jgi:hypothetical protein
MPLEKSKRATFYDQFNLTERRKIRVWQIAYRKHPERFVAAAARTASFTSGYLDQSTA